jgi:hypothetical protein
LYVFQPKIPIWQVLGGFAMEDTGIFHGPSVNFQAIWYILWLFGVFYGTLVYFMALWYILWSFVIFSRFWILYHDKSGNPVENGNSVVGSVGAKNDFFDGPDQVLSTLEPSGAVRCCE